MLDEKKGTNLGRVYADVSAVIIDEGSWHLQKLKIDPSVMQALIKDLAAEDLKAKVLKSSKVFCDAKLYKHFRKLMKVGSYDSMGYLKKEGVVAFLDHQFQSVFYNELMHDYFYPEAVE